MKLKYYILAGEASGDLHGANLMKGIIKNDANAEFRFWGGDLMEAVGGTLVKHYKERAFMGFAEIISNLKTVKTHKKKVILLFLHLVKAPSIAIVQRTYGPHSSLGYGKSCSCCSYFCGCSNYRL